MCRTINRDRHLRSCIHQGGVWFWPLLSMPHMNWCAGSTIYQWPLVCWGSARYSSHRKHPWKPFPTCTRYTWPFWYRQILCDAKGFILLAEHAHWPWKILHPLMRSLPVQQILDNKSARWWAWYRGRTQYPSIFVFLVFLLWRWLTMMHGTNATLHVSCVSPRDHTCAQCSIFVKSLLLTAPLFGRV